MFVCRADFEEDEYVQAKRHYSQAMVDEVLYNLNDNVHVKVSFIVIAFLINSIIHLLKNY